MCIWLKFGYAKFDKNPQSEIFLLHFLRILVASQVYNLLIVQWLPV